MHSSSSLITTPLKNSAKSFDGSWTATFLLSLDNFFLIEFKLVMLILEIGLLLQSILQLLVHSMFQKQCQDHEVLCF